MFPNFDSGLSESKYLDQKAQLLTAIGKLQSRFMLGEDVLLPLCQLLAEQSGAQAVLLVDVDSMASEDLPTNASCWCHDPVRFLTLWKDVKEWPFSEQVPSVHRWHKYVVWPVKNSKVIAFFHTPKEDWFVFLHSEYELLADMLAGVFVQQAMLWTQQEYTRKFIPLEEGMFQSIVSNSEDLIVVVRPDVTDKFVIVYANAAAICITEHPRSYLVGKPVSILFSEDDSNDLGGANALGSAMQHHDEFNGELWCIKANGEKVLLHLHALALDADSTAERLYVLLGRDITIQRQLQTALARTQKMQAIGQLVGGIAHDFNNILGVLKGNLELMELKNSDDRLNRYLASAMRSCQRGTDLTRRLLQFSRQEQFNAQNFDVNELILGLKDLLAKSLNNQIDFGVELSKNLPLIKVDKGDFEDAILNLVLNAKDAMETGGKLTIYSGIEKLSGFLPSSGGRVVVEPGEYVWVSIADTGTGIPEHLIEKIFEPFFSTKDKSKGTGLGLAMAYGFVKRSRGYMSVIKSSEQGSEFRLWFPRVESNYKAVLNEQRPQHHYPKVDGKIKAVLVDDEPELLEVLRNYCEHLSIETEVFIDPSSALSKYQHGGCDAQLLITDVLMPGGINGYELASLLERNNRLKILLISGYIENIGIDNFDDMPYRVLHKPFDLSLFIASLEELGIVFLDEGN